MRIDAMASGEDLYTYCSALNDERLREMLDALDELRKNAIDPQQFHDVLVRVPYLQPDGQVLTLIAELARFVPSIDRMIGYTYQRFGLLEVQQESEAEPASDSAVLVTTMHSAKGLEAEFVFIPWLNDTFMPMQGREPEEQRRLLYVAMTRARQDVTLTFHERYDPVKKKLLKLETMSPFLKSIREHLTIERITVDHLN